MLRHPFVISCAVSTAVVVILGGTLGKPVPSVSEQRFWQHVHLDRTLDQPAGLTAVDQPLAEVLQTLAERYAVPIFFHPDDLVGRQTVTIDVHGVRLRSLLSLILEPHDLEFAVQEQQVVVSPLGWLGESPTRLDRPRLSLAAAAGGLGRNERRGLVGNHLHGDRAVQLGLFRGRGFVCPSCPARWSSSICPKSISR
jgi:hypothetical protein